MPANNEIDTGPKPLRWLRERHPDVAGDNHEYLEDIRALYEGGRFLLKNREVFQRLFPQMAGETDASYKERCKAAFYVNNLATVIDFIVSGLAQDKARIRPEGARVDEVTVDEFLVKWEQDTSPRGGEKVPYAELLSVQGRNGLLYQRWWTLIDLPAMGPDFNPTSRLEQEQAGALDAYAVALDPLSIMDWCANAAGELEWVRTCTHERVRSSPTSTRDTQRTEYRLYTRTHWALYVVEHRDGQAPPSEDQTIAPIAGGPHGFGRVPVIPGCLPPGLWAGNKLHSLAAEYLRKSNGLSWAEVRSIYQQLYEFLDNSLPGIDEAPKDGAAADPHRAVRQPRGPGKVQTRGANDKAEFIGPDPGPFAHIATSLEGLRDDMYRVTYQMALAADTSGAAIRRSAESKGKDGESGVIVLVALGDILRRHGDDVLALVTTIRSIAKKHVTAGLEKFEVDDLEAAINRAVMLETVTLPSATAKKLLAVRLLRQILGADATADVMSEIEKELDEAITQDQLTAPPPPAPGAVPEDPSAAAEPADTEEPEPEDDPKETAPPPKAKRKPKR